MLGTALAFYLTLFLFRGLLADSQYSSANQKVLQASSSHVLEVPSFAYVGPGRCDSNGNLFFLMMPNGSSKGSYVLSLSQSTGKPTVYQSSPDLSANSAFLGFYVSPSDKVWLLDENAPAGEVYLIGFNSDGKMRSKTRLDTPRDMEPQEFAVSDLGVTFIRGFFPSNAPTSLRGRAYVALFDSYGKLINEVKRESRVDLGISMAERIPPPNVAVAADLEGNFWYVRPDAAVVISPSGDVREQFPIDKPSKDAIIFSVTLSDNLASIHFFQPSPNGKLTSHFLVLDRATGQSYSGYTPAPELGHSAVCFTRKSGYTFFRSENRKVKLLSAPLN